MTDKTEILNPGTTPVVYSNDGRVLAAGERIAVSRLDATARAARDRGDLVVEEKEDETEESNGESSEESTEETAGGKKETTARRGQK